MLGSTKKTHGAILKVAANERTLTVESRESKLCCQSFQEISRAGQRDSLPVEVLHSLPSLIPWLKPVKDISA